LAATVEAPTGLADVIDRARFGKERIVLTRGGEGLAAIVSLDDVAFLETYLNVMKRLISELIEDAMDETDRKIAEEVLQEVAAEGTVPWEKIKQDLNI
jgi:antitoxin (DNA-binding transcriptional repressor) of toxin-antitoxin stability system